MRPMHLILPALAGLALATLALAGGHGEEAPSGQAVFETSCANCHTGGFGGFFTGATKLGKAGDWEESLFVSKESIAEAMLCAENGIIKLLNSNWRRAGRLIAGNPVLKSKPFIMNLPILLFTS